MPKSKRNKQVELAKTKKRGFEGKQHLYNEVRSCIDTYAHLFIFSVTDMRNAKMKSVREQWRHSRFFIGKNKVMARALGRSPEEEYRPYLHQIGEQLKGERGLLFSNQPIEEVVRWFSSYSEQDYARSGNIATENVALSVGPMPQFPHSLESYLRQLGLPTTLQKGVVHLVKDHVVCKQGETLTPETARLLKLLGYEMSEFHVNIECVWSQDGSFQDLKSDSPATNGEGNKVKVHKVSPSKEGNEISIVANNEDETMEEMETNEDKDEELENFLKQKEYNDDEEEAKQPTYKGKEADGDILQKDSDSEEYDEPCQISDESEIAWTDKVISKNEQNGSDPKQVEDEQSDEDDINEENGSDPKVEEVPDKVSILKLTEQKLKNDNTPPKYSPKMTRARAQGTLVKKAKVSKGDTSAQAATIDLVDVKSPEEIALRTRAARKISKKNKI